MSSITSSPPVGGLSARVLHWAGGLWFLVAAVGQLAFIGFILAFYGVRTVTGDFAGWNDKPLIDGYTEGDHAGNFVFAVHVLLASVVTLAGLMQMIPLIRKRWPRVHRWTGRLFLSIGGFMALSGVWLALVRGTYLSMISNVAILFNAVLILIFASLAWRATIRRRFDQHRLWAMRTFMVISGVWFLRVGLMGWVVLNKGPVGMNDTLSGPADIVLTFGSYLIPLALLELWFAADRSHTALAKLAAAAVMVVAALYTGVGVFGTVALMWAPHVFG